MKNPSSEVFENMRNVPLDSIGLGHWEPQGMNENQFVFTGCPAGITLRLKGGEWILGIVLFGVINYVLCDNSVNKYAAMAKATIEVDGFLKKILKSMPAI